MKINDKNLCAFAVSATPVDKEGYLNKRGEVNKNFQKRYFVLKGNLLFYFDRKGDKEPVGVIILEGCTIELSEDDELFCFKIEFHGTNNRSYVLGAESQESMEQWMKALACAGFDYMKLMVAELQRQLADIEDNCRALQISCVTCSDHLKFQERGRQKLIIIQQASCEQNVNIQDAPSQLSQVVGSPVPPPRQRHNPFNNLEGSNHQRSHSMRSTSSRIEMPHRSTDPVKVTITFRELHNSYGRPILTDFNAWKHDQRKRMEKVEDSLITL